MFFLGANLDIARQLEVYVPLRFSLKPTADSLVRPLQNLMESLLTGSTESVFACLDQKDARVIFLQGTAGTGKSMFGWKAMQHYDLQLKAGSKDLLRMPVFINLANIDKDIFDPDKEGDRQNFLLTQALEAYPVRQELKKIVAKFNPDSLIDLYSEAFVFFLDGVDELGCDKSGEPFSVHSLYDAAKWKESFFVITARTGFFSVIEKAHTCIASKQPVNDIYLLAFNKEQIDSYVAAFANRFHDDEFKGWTADKYTEALAHLPGLQAFLDEPLLIFMVLNILPLMDKSSKNIEGKVLALDREFLQVGLIDSTDSFKFFSRTELYSLFVSNWVERELRRKGGVGFDAKGQPLPKSSIVRGVLDFCQKLAFEMFLHNKLMLELPPETELAAPVIVDTFSREFRDFQKKKLTEANVQSALPISIRDLLESTKTTATLEFRSSPLKKSGRTFGFLHKTIQEYFVAMAIGRELGRANLNDDCLVFSPLQEQLTQGKFSTKTAPLLLAQKLLHADGVLNTIRFCADLVDRRVQSYVSLGPIMNRASGQFSENGAAWSDRASPMARALVDIVQASRTDRARANPDCAISAANAVTILNAANVIFDHCNLSHATLGPVAPTLGNSTAKFFAGLSGAVLSNADLSYACLAQADLSSACLDGATLAHANLSQVDFGQRPMLLGHDGSVNCVAYSHAGKHVNDPPKYIVSGSWDSTVKIWSVETGEVIRTLQGHSSIVNSVAFSPENKYIVSGSYD